MTEISFGSTFRIPVTQQGITKAKKVKLKSLIGSYNGLVGTGNTGYAIVSIPNEKDASFLRKLKEIGYKFFQMFEGENIPKKALNDYIKNCIDGTDYKQFDKQKNFLNSKVADAERQNQIRNSASYKDIVARYGKEAAEAIFFYSR